MSYSNRNDLVYDFLRDQLTDILHELREEAGLTQNQVASKIDRSQVYVSNIEQGRRRIDLIELLEVLAVYDVEVQAVIDRLDRGLAKQQAILQTRGSTETEVE